MMRRCLPILVGALCGMWPAVSTADGWQLSGAAFIRVHASTIEFYLTGTDANGEPVANISDKQSLSGSVTLCLNEGCVNTLPFHATNVDCKVLNPDSHAHCFAGGLTGNLTVAQVSDKDAAAVVTVRLCRGIGGIGAGVSCTRAMLPVAVLP